MAAAPGVKAFPTAEGFGAGAVGGRGGRVIEVTHLGDSGPGSFRPAMEAAGPRIVVFRVSGTITLANAIRAHAISVAGKPRPRVCKSKAADGPGRLESRRSTLPGLRVPAAAT
jgi:pectate lyase